MLHISQGAKQDLTCICPVRRYDLIICILRFDEWGISYLIHASCCALIYAYGLSEQVLHFYGAMFLTWELSTPCESAAARA